MTERCCNSCKGSPPYFTCRDPLALGWLNNPVGCGCHVTADALAAKTPNRLGHADKTADTAIANIMNPTKRKRP